VQYWWVSHNQTHAHEIQGGFLWSPKRRADGFPNYFYSTMEKVRPGDVVFSFYGSAIRQVGIVQSPATTAIKPNFGSAGANWHEIGWNVEVEFTPILSPVRPKENLARLAPLMANRYAPIDGRGHGNQGVYLTDISEELALVIAELGDVDLPAVESALSPLIDDSEPLPELEDPVTGARTVEGGLERLQLVLARRGQGVFRHNVRLRETHCRLTGVSNPRHLRASHIKPWSQSNHDERVDGDNGLMLSPHVDHLFDQGFVSFRSDGTIIRSPELENDVMRRWSLDTIDSAGSFSSEQGQFLEYHRDVLLRLRPAT
jgi:putative restriction endonuclease